MSAVRRSGHGPTSGLHTQIDDVLWPTQGPLDNVATMTTPIALREALGLYDLPSRLRETWLALRGAEDVPPSRFGLSSLRLYNPRLGIPLWRGKFIIPNRAIITNLFNHLQTPIKDGWSVRVTQVRDFRGRGMTYDSHNGTDLAIPVGTTVVAPAPGRVVRRYCEYNRGGNKLVLDHGGGLFTCCAHLARFLVEEGQQLERGETMALSGYSGLDAIASGPCGIPHVHFNVWHKGEPVDPFAHGDAASLWVGGTPQPPSSAIDDTPFVPTRFDEHALARAIDGCLTRKVREKLQSCPSVYDAGCMLISEWCYYPTRFPVRPNIFSETTERRGLLTMPLAPAEITSAVFADDL